MAGIKDSRRAALLAEMGCSRCGRARNIDMAVARRPKPCATAFRRNADDALRPDGAHCGFLFTTPAVPSFSPAVLELFPGDDELFLAGPERYLRKNTNSARKASSRRYSRPLVAKIFT